MHSDEQIKVEAVAIIEQLSKSMQRLKIMPRAIEINIDVDIDGNVSAIPTGIAIRVVLPCTI